MEGSRGLAEFEAECAFNPIAGWETMAEEVAVAATAAAAEAAETDEFDGLCNAVEPAVPTGCRCDMSLVESNRIGWLLLLLVMNWSRSSD